MKEQQRQIALVTGSASGIGFETALLLARNGIYTFATMRNLSKSEEILDYARKENLPLEILHNKKKKKKFPFLPIKFEHIEKISK